jgi:hypothetical protein
MLCHRLNGVSPWIIRKIDASKARHNFLEEVTMEVAQYKIRGIPFHQTRVYTWEYSRYRIIWVGRSFRTSTQWLMAHLFVVHETSDHFSKNSGLFRRDLFFFGKSSLGSETVKSSL